MKYIKCDGCENMSPDENGLHTSNGWVDIKVNSRWRKFNRFADPMELSFCNECIPYPKHSDPEAGAIKKFFNKFFNRSKK